MYFLSGVACDVTQTNITWSLLMYFSYFILFARRVSSSTKNKTNFHI